MTTVAKTSNAEFEIDSFFSSTVGSRPQGDVSRLDMSDHRD